MSKSKPEVVSVFPIRQQMISVCETPLDSEPQSQTKNIDSAESSDVLNTVVIRSTYATAQGITERELICEGVDNPISKVADAMVSEHEKVNEYQFSLRARL